MRPCRHFSQRVPFFMGAILPMAVLVASCAHLLGSPPPSGASSEGVRFTIRDYECTQIGETADSRRAADLIIDLEINNPSAVPVVVRPGAMEVVDQEGGSMKRRGLRQRGPVEVAAGSRQNLTMHFLGSQDHCCSSRLSLQPTGVTLGDRTLAVGKIDFVPACLF